LDWSWFWDGGLIEPALGTCITDPVPWNAGYIGYELGHEAGNCVLDDEPTFELTLDSDIGAEFNGRSLIVREWGSVILFVLRFLFEKDWLNVPAAATVVNVGSLNNVLALLDAMVGGDALNALALVEAMGRFDELKNVLFVVCPPAVLL
jgi:uncharacterized membrane protein (DUF485 family)